MRHLATAFFLLVLAAPFRTYASTYWCDPLLGSCANPYSSVDGTIQQLQLNNSLQQLQQSQTIQNKENQLVSKYGSSAYNSCMYSVCPHMDAGSFSSVSICQTQAVSCLQNYQSGQQAKTACLQGGNGQWQAYAYGTVGYGSGQCTCNTGYQLSNGTCIVKQTQIDGCKTSYGPYAYSGTKGCLCTAGSSWGTWNGKLGCAPASTQPSTIQASQTASVAATKSKLTATQITAIVSLLQSFNVDATIIAKVKATLGG